MLPLRSLRRLVRAERIHASLGDAGAGLALPLPSRRTWIAGLGVGLASLVVASIAWQQLRVPRRPPDDTIVGLVTVVLRWCWVGGLWVGALALVLPREYPSHRVTMNHDLIPGRQLQRA